MREPHKTESKTIPWVNTPWLDAAIAERDIALVEAASQDRAFFEAVQAMTNTAHELGKRALAGDESSALDLASLATFCTQKLHEVAAKHPATFEGREVENVPVMIGRDTLEEKERWPKKVKRAAILVGGSPDSRTGIKHTVPPQADTLVRSLVDCLAEGLAKRRGPDSISAEGELVDHGEAVRTIILHNEWQSKEGGKVWKGWAGAARFLPPPSRDNAPLWWDVAEKRLRKLWGGDWFKSARFLKRVEKEFRGDSIAVSHDRRQVESRFLKAVERL